MDTNELKVFQNEEFGKLRVVEVDGKPYFVGKDIATSLGYKNTRVALQDNVADADKVIVKIATPGGNQDAVVINESGMCALVLGSRLKSANNFKHWVTTEVLFSAREQCEKSDESSTSSACESPSNATTSHLVKKLVPEKLKVFCRDSISDIKEIQKNKSTEYMGFFYVLEYDDCVKIGCTRNPYERIRTLVHDAEKYGKSHTNRVAISLEHTNYRENEKFLHKLFASYRKLGTELFNITFDEAVSTIKNVDIEILDESAKIEKESEFAFNGLMHSLFGSSLPFCKLDQPLSRR